MFLCFVFLHHRGALRILLFALLAMTIKAIHSWVKNNPSWVKYGQAQRLGYFDPAIGSAGQFYLTQLLFKNDYMAILKLTQNRLEIKNQTLYY